MRRCSESWVVMLNTQTSQDAVVMRLRLGGNFTRVSYTISLEIWEWKKFENRLTFDWIITKDCVGLWECLWISVVQIKELIFRSDWKTANWSQLCLAGESTHILLSPAFSLQKLISFRESTFYGSIDFDDTRNRLQPPTLGKWVRANAVMLCGWAVNAGMAHSTCGLNVMVAGICMIPC